MSAPRPISRDQRWLRVAPQPGMLHSEPPPRVDDDALIEAAVRGDTRLAGQLHDRLLPVVERTIFRIFGTLETDHDDMVQNTFEQIVLTLVKKRFGRACSLSTWASTVAAHVAFKALRSRRRERRVFDRSVEDQSSVPCESRVDVERDVHAKRQVERVRRHLAEIDPKKAMAVVLHDVLGHDLSEIAAMTDSSVAAVQSRLVRGRGELLARMARESASGVGKERDGAG
jgi:RNA polymerase sigma-70 factor, ECF subfamily